MLDQIEDHYRGEHGAKYQEQKRAVPPAAYPWVARLRAEKFQPHILPDHSVLEVGAGLGWNLAALRCAARTAVDFEDFLPAELKSSGVKFARTSADLPSQTFDVIICHHVLEHVERPTDMLADIRRLLRPSGKLLLHVPFEKEKRYRHFNPKEPNHHLYSWNVQTLGNLVSESGYNIQSAAVARFGYDRAAALWSLRLSLGETGFRALRFLAHCYRPALEIRIVATT